VGVLSLSLSLTAAAQEAGKRVALLVGVNRYDKRGFRDLEYAERDVEELAKVLEPAGYEVHVLTASATGANRATLKNIQAALDGVVKERTKNDTVVIALTGHGLQIEVTGADGKLRAESFFCPADAQREDDGDRKAHETMLAMGTVFDKLDRRGGGYNLVLVDACREDPTRGKGLDGSKVQGLPEGVAVLFACRAGQRSFETKNAGGGHGVFFHHVLRGLRGEAKNSRDEITWSRLAEYVTEQVPVEVPRLLEDKFVRQTPNELKNLPGPSPVLLTARPQLYVIAVGVNEYESRVLPPLRFAVADAKKISQVFSDQSKPLFQNVQSRVVVDPKAKCSDALDALQWLQRNATDGDLSVISYAGRQAKDERGDFHLLLSDSPVKGKDDKGFARIATASEPGGGAKSLPLARFREEVAKVRGRVLVLLDTCQSGAAVKPLQAIGSRVTVLAAAEDEQPSFEHEQLGHGLFTLAVAEGLGGLADEDGNHVVDVRELEKYVVGRVDMLSQQVLEKRQRPQGAGKGRDPFVLTAVGDKKEAR
jgi:uncharacterized caspase-like protein